MGERKNESYKVPEGYFESLRTRLRAIPSETDGCGTETVTVWDKTRPLLALAASIAVMFVCGTAVLKLAESKKADATDCGYAEYAWKITPHTEPYALYDASTEPGSAEDISGDDIVAYLIDTGVSLNQLSYEEQEYE